MGLQLIFVVETNKKSKSDWIYIKDTLEYFYKYDTNVKLTPVYMDGKGRYKNKQKEIQSYISQYSSTSQVIYCFDCDDYDSKPEDLTFLNNAHRYCDEHGYDFVWFCKDIEHVYIGKRIQDKQKQNEAVRFKAKKHIGNINECNLSYNSFQSGASNIMNVLDKYLERK